MKSIEYEIHICKRCGKTFAMPSYYVVIPNYCDKCIIELIKIGEIKPHVNRRKTVEK